MKYRTVVKKSTETEFNGWFGERARGDVLYRSQEHWDDWGSAYDAVNKGAVTWVRVKAEMIYPISEHRFISVAELDEKDGRIAELTAENERLKAELALLKAIEKGLQMFAEEDAKEIKALEALVKDLTAALESREARF